MLLGDLFTQEVKNKKGFINEDDTINDASVPDHHHPPGNLVLPGNVRYSGLPVPQRVVAVGDKGRQLGVAADAGGAAAADGARRSRA